MAVCYISPDRTENVSCGCIHLLLQLKSLQSYANFYKNVSLQIPSVGLSPWDNLELYPTTKLCHFAPKPCYFPVILHEVQENNILLLRAECLNVILGEAQETKTTYLCAAREHTKNGYFVRSTK